jgi:hypothetical protein
MNKQKPSMKPAHKPTAMPMMPRPGTREYREAQRMEFGKRFEAAKKGRKR